MSHGIRLRPDLSDRLEGGAKADIRLCWTCGSCDAECPVNIATGALRPQKIVRMAALGLLEDLTCLPEIWYCARCRRCAQICPNAVKPSDLIEHIRVVTADLREIPPDILNRFSDLWRQFQRVRWHAVAACLAGDELDELPDGLWNEWLATPVPEDHRSIRRPAAYHPPEDLQLISDTHHLSACFTCGECSSACPVACERSVFDPRSLFRMVYLGLEKELLSLPSIWLCVGCRRCSDCCSQQVDGRQIVAGLQDLAVAGGVVDPNFRQRLEKAHRVLYNRFISEIDTLLHDGKCAATDASPGTRKRKLDKVFSK